MNKMCFFFQFYICCKNFRKISAEIKKYCGMQFSIKLYRANVDIDYHFVKKIMDLICLGDCAKFNFKYTCSRFSYLILKKRGRISDMAAGLIEAGCDGTRSALSTLHFVPRYLQSELSHRPKLGFGLKKLINSTLFATGDNNALEFISN